MMAPWIIDNLPLHKIYVEPFGGAASVLLRKPPSDVEIYNDLNDELVNFFKVLRNPYTSTRLIALLEKTPYSRTEFNQAYLPSSFSIERARRLAIKAIMGYGATGASRNSKTGFRHQVSKGRAASKDWQNYPAALARVTSRLRSVVIENRPALDIIDAYDKSETLFYIDPPYMWDTRTKNSKYQEYQHEMDDKAHTALLTRLNDIKGMVVLSAYEHPIYDQYLSGWKKITKQSYAMNGKPRKEVLWIKP